MYRNSTPLLDCEFRRSVAWLAENAMMESHLKTTKFFGGNTHRCTVEDPNGREREVTYNNDPLVPPAL